MFPESKLLSSAVTVWGALSSFVHLMVLLTPIITVIFAGKYPGFEVSTAAPDTMLTAEGGGAEVAEVAIDVVADEVVDEVVGPETTWNTPTAPFEA